MPTSCPSCHATLKPPLSSGRQLCSRCGWRSRDPAPSPGVSQNEQRSDVQQGRDIGWEFVQKLQVFLGNATRRKGAIKPGENPRKLALLRRQRAVGAFLIAGMIATAPWGVQWCLSSLVNFPTPGTGPVITLPGVLYLVCLAAAGLPLFAGWELIQKARRAEQGAQAEEEIAQVLQQLPPGWQVEYGLSVPGVGDIDVTLRSPENRWYVLEVKSHAGIVEVQGNRLLRRLGDRIFPFEKDFLKQVWSQVDALKQLRRLTYVTPVLVFTRARVAGGSQKVRGVIVAQQQELLALLS